MQSMSLPHVLQPNLSFRSFSFRSKCDISVPLVELGDSCCGPKVTALEPSAVPDFWCFGGD